MARKWTARLGVRSRGRRAIRTGVACACVVDEPNGDLELERVKDLRNGSEWAWAGLELEQATGVAREAKTQEVTR